jgi:hypothetical protein
MLHGLAAASVTASVATPVLAQQPAPAARPAAPSTSPLRPEPPQRVEIKTRPVESFDAREPDRTRFGPLEFRGGLELSSPHKSFGGISAIRLLPDGERFVAVSDRGRWVRGRIVYRGTKPAGVVDGEIAPILGPDGRTLASIGWFDTEALAIDGNTLYVGIERVHRIVRFDYGRHGLLARGQPIPVPPGMATLNNNLSIEALTAVPKGLPLGGSLIAISERGLDPAGNIRGFMIDGMNFGEFTIVRQDSFDISDCAVLPTGELLLLERRFAWTSGVAVRLRRIPLASIAPGALVDGPGMLTADMGYQIDNMEGLDVHRTGDGDVVITMISDDNFSILQRTLLLQFTLVDQ